MARDRYGEDYEDDYDDGIDEYDDRPRRRRRLRADVEPHRATTVLVLGILGIVFCQICAPIAWVMGKNDLESMRNGQMDPEGEGMTKAGYICGIVGSILLILQVLLVIFYICIVAIVVANDGKF